MLAVNSVREGGGVILWRQRTVLVARQWLAALRARRAANARRLWRSGKG
jgi:hypothetical protein